MQSQKTLTQQCGKWLNSLVFLGFLLIIAEVFSYIYFQYLLPQQLRDNARFTIWGISPLPQEVKPYLWSNYAPNPQSPQVNQYGWRYGGGAKGDHFRILCLGGSTTWSAKVSEAKKSYPAQLEKYLQNLGYHVDVVNAGVSYYTSAEEVGTLAFRGIYTEPDLVLIHTGGNDIFPFLSPETYQPDYSHWRMVDEQYDNLSRNDMFRAFWHVPSWTFRLFLTVILKPDAFIRAMVAKQPRSAEEDILDINDISQRQAIGLEKNLTTLISIARGHGADVVTILFNFQYDRLHTLIPSLQENPVKYQNAKERVRFAMESSNKTIQHVSDEMGVPVIPFDLFVPSNNDFWVDQCHLNDEGTLEKAIFIGQWLIEHDILAQAKK